MNAGEERPEVSVILPSNNPQKSWIEETLESVLGQTFRNFEVIILDDGSSPPLRELLEDKYLNHEKVKYFREKNGSFTKSTNSAIKKARGSYISPIGDDDKWDKDKLKKQVSVAKSKKADVVFTEFSKIDENGEIIEDGEKLPSENRHYKLKMGCYPCYESSLIKEELIRDLGYMSKDFNIVSDYDLWFRVWPRSKIEFIKECLVSKRDHTENISNTSNELIKEGEEVRKRHIEEKKTLDKSLSKFYRRNGKKFFELSNKKKARRLWIKALKNRLSLKTTILLLASISSKSFIFTVRSYTQIKSMKN
jgi:glycosyltransferase involved in cell wall biosynthesis